MPLIATASVNEVNVVPENVDKSTIGPRPSEGQSSEPSTVEFRSLDSTPGIPREIGVLGPAVRTDVCRLWNDDPPETELTRERTIALPTALRGVVRDDMFFVKIQFLNRWTSSLMDTGASRNLMSLAFFDQLSPQPELRPPGETRVIAGNGASLDLRGWTTLVVAIGGHCSFTSLESSETCHLMSFVARS